MSNKFLKKEYYLPLAIIIGTIIIGLSIYLGITAEYRDKKAYCEKFLKETTAKNTEKDLFYETLLAGCIKKQSE
jgi:hypothetical protein